MTILQPAPIAATRLTLARDASPLDACGALCLLVGELSEVRLGRVYDDACDEGLTVVSPRGRRVVCAVEHQERDAEGDLLYLVLRPVRPAERSLVTVRLYND